MTDERDEDESGDERHSFRSATISATDDQNSAIPSKISRVPGP